MSAQGVRTDQYRRVLALLPRAYREQRGEEMLTVMLDMAASEGRTSPSFRQLLSILGLSLRLRAGAPGASARARTVGETLRLITLIGLLLQAATFAFAPAELVRLWTVPTPGVGVTTALSRYDIGQLICELSGFICPFLALAALLRGNRRLGLGLTANALALLTSLHLFNWLLFFGFPGPVYVALALCAIPTITGLLGFHHQAPPVPRPRRWFTAMFLATVPLVVLDSMPTSLSDSAVASNVFAIICGLAAVGVAVSRTSRGAAWPAALIVAGIPLLLMLPYSITTWSASAGVPITARLLQTDPSTCAAFYALGIEALLTLALAASLVRHATSDQLGG